MDCSEARIHVSAMQDGEAAPLEAAEHVRSCPECRRLLQDYAALSSQIRMLASEWHAGEDEKEIQLPSLINRPTAWARAFAGQARVPRFVIILGVAIIAALTAGLVFLEAQGKKSGVWFTCELTWPQAEYKGSIHPTNLPQIGMGFNTQAKTNRPEPFFISGPDRNAGTIAGLIQMEKIQRDQVSFAIRAKHFDAADKTAEEIMRAAPPLQLQQLGKVLSDIPPRQYTYQPGTTLTIPVEGISRLIFEGRTGDSSPKFSWQQFPLQPSADELVLDGPALVEEKALLAQPRGSTKVSSPNGCAYIYVPDKGLLILALRQFPGAHEAAADGGRALFELGHKWYYVFSERPLIGGKRTRTIWVYLAKNYTPSQSGLEWNPKTPFVGSSDNVEQVLAQLKN